MKGSIKAAGKEKRKCMVLTANDKLRERILLILKDSDVVVYTPIDEHNALCYLFENYIDFLVIDVDCWDNKDWDYPGFEFASKVREKFGYIRKPIIFLSSDENGKLYAYEKFNCVSYIVKPVDKKPFLLAVEKALIYSEKIFLKIPRYVKSNSVYFSLYMDEISYIDVCNRDVYFHIMGGSQIEIANSHLSHYADEARREGFIQIRRDIMVNTRHIINIDFSNRILMITDGTELGIGYAYKDELTEYVKRYGLDAGRKKRH
jgi:two-component system LytT family response regulator